MAQNLAIYTKYINAGSSSNQIYQDCIQAGSSSQDATETAYPTNRNKTNQGTTYKSSATVQKTYSTASYSVLHPNNSNKTGSLTKTVMIPANTSFNTIIDSRITPITTSSLLDASQSPSLGSVNASKFTTTYSTGVVLVVGDDSKIVDVNLANGFGISGQQQATRGWVKFGNGGPLWGHNGNQSTTPLAGDGLYSITGSLLVSSSKLLFYNGTATNNGWAVII